MGWPVGVSVPVLWSTLNCTTVSEFWFAANRYSPVGSSEKLRGVLPCVEACWMGVSKLTFLNKDESRPAVTAFQVDGGKLKEIQEVPSIPADCNWPSEFPFYLPASPARPLRRITRKLYIRLSPVLTH